jgi:hypothetical protein
MNWNDKTAEEVVTDVNVALSAVYDATYPSPGFMAIPVRTYWQILRYPILALMLRNRRVRRPRRFTRQLTLRYWQCG